MLTAPSTWLNEALLALSLSPPTSWSPSVQTPPQETLPVRQSHSVFLAPWPTAQMHTYLPPLLAEFPVVGFGLRATKMLEERERVLVVPRSAMLTVQSAREGPLKSFISQQLLLNAMPNLALAIHLLNERYTVDSKWKPYISKRTAYVFAYLHLSLHFLRCTTSHILSSSLFCKRRT